MAQRQSPDWRALAALYEATGAVAPGDYLPDGPIPGFPAQLDSYVEEWNRLFSLNYFAVRARLKDIALDTVAAAGDVLLLSYTNLASVLTKVRPEVPVFFFDDDDWFAPNLVETCDRLPGNGEVFTFPLPLLQAGYFTLVDPNCKSRPAILGPARAFQFALHTNNYCLRARLHARHDLLLFKDHVNGSTQVEERRLEVTHFPSVVSASLKSPASAGSLLRLRDRRVFSAALGKFVVELESLELPPDFVWMEGHVSRVVRLFRELMASRKG